LLRLIAGLDTVTAGTIWVGDRRVNDLPPKDRDIAMVFQNYALYPHMRVYDNLAFGLRRAAPASPSSSALPRWLENLLASITRPLPKDLRYWSAQERAIDQRVGAVAEMLQIEGLLHRFPKQLSGGQKQRVALGRAMARNPAVFLMDEPLSNLDAKLRAETRAQIVNLQRQLGITAIYVTHDQVEAMTMGDRIAVIHAGQIQQIAPPLELYNHPANQYVAGFIGSPPMNFLPVQVAAPTTIVHNQVAVTLPDTWTPALAPYAGQTMTLGIRPEHLHPTSQTDTAFQVTVQRVEALGNETYVTTEMVGTRSGDRHVLQIRLSPDIPVQLGDVLWLGVAVDRAHLFDRETGLAITS
jgi:multiple sugar transport system ATP-binding protein